MELMTTEVGVTCPIFLTAGQFTGYNLQFFFQDMPIASSLSSLTASPITTQPRPKQILRDSGALSTSGLAVVTRGTSGCTHTLARQLVDLARVTSLSSTGDLTTTTALMQITTPAGVDLTGSTKQEAGAPVN